MSTSAIDIQAARKAAIPIATTKQLTRHCIQKGRQDHQEMFSVAKGRDKESQKVANRKKTGDEGNVSSLRVNKLRRIPVSNNHCQP